MCTFTWQGIQKDLEPCVRMLGLVVDLCRETFLEEVAEEAGWVGEKWLAALSSLVTNPDSQAKKIETLDQDH